MSTSLLTACARAVEERDHTAAMAVGPPTNWAIDIDPEVPGKEALMVRPDNNIRVELTKNGSGYDVKLSGKINDTPDPSWIARQEERASHILEGYARMSFVARKFDDINPPKLIDYEHTPPKISDGVALSEYTYEWGMKQYQVTVENHDRS